MKKIILLLAVLALATAVEWESGVDFTIHWEDPPIHKLQSESGVPREVEVQVSFGKTFSKIPKVLITLSVLDTQSGQPTNFKCFVKSISTKSFIYACKVWTDKQYYSFRVNWLAILDSKIQFNYIDLETKQLQTGKRNLQGDETVSQAFGVTWDYPFEDVPNVQVYVLGANVLDEHIQAIVEVDNDATNQEGTSIVVKATTSHIQTVSVVVVASETGFSRIANDYYNSGDAADEWTRPNSNGRSVPCVPQVIPDQFLDPAKALLITGINGFDADKSTNLRVAVNDVKIEQQEDEDGQPISVHTCQLSTWADSVTYQIYYGIFMYVPQEDCATLFTECNYKGDILQICAGSPINSFQQQKFEGKNVKSIKVPHGRTLTLYDQENQNGDFIVVEKDQTCIESWQWTKKQ